MAYGFSSCTESLEVLESEQFLGQTGSRTLFNIECNNGKFIKDYSCYKSENEILLLPATQFQVKSKFSPAPGLYIIHIKEIKPKYHLLESPFDSTIISTSFLQKKNDSIPHSITAFNDILVPSELQNDEQLCLKQEFEEEVATKNKTTIGMNSNCKWPEDKSSTADLISNEHQMKESYQCNQSSDVDVLHLSESLSGLKLMTMTDILQPGSIVRDRWKVLHKVKDYAFNQFYEAFDVFQKENVLLIIESAHQPRQTLKMYATVLRRLQGKDHICKFMGGGTNDVYNYLITNLQGKSLDTLRSSQSGRCFSLSTSIRISLQVLECIETIHSIGFLHRDIQPCNFVMGTSPSSFRQVFILNFGLARKYTNAEGNVRIARPQAEFRGSVIYASINAFKNYELGRHDDLWSLFYMLIEFIVGYLPWEATNDKKQIEVMKKQFDHRDFLKILPIGFDKFLEHIQKLNYEDKPNYDLLRNVFFQSIRSQGYKDSDLFDWEEINDKK